MVRDNGIGAEYSIPYDIALTLMVFITVALYNVCELTVLIFTTFKRYGGLYFYSLLVATWGICPYALGFFFKFYDIKVPTMFYLTFIAIGWWSMVTGQSMVLYSRLHLVYRSTTSSGRWVLYMIITNAIICHIPTTILTYGSNSSHAEPYIRPYAIYERVQVTIFFIQEVIISALYVYKTWQILQSEGGIRGRNARKVMTHLIWVNVIIIILDVTVLAIEYAGFYNVQVIYKAAVYSVKLKMEFSILNRLLDLFQGRIDETSDDQHIRSHHGNAFTLNRQSSKPKPLPGAGGLGNTAYARMDDNIVKGANRKDIEVVKTTEVRIERNQAYAIDRDIEMESVATVSLKNDGVRRASSSSSEARIVKPGVY